MKKIILSFFLICFFSFCTFSQNQANIWYFGHYTGLDFNGDSVKIIEGTSSTLHDITTICNTSGELLFYVNDRNEMYNHKHELVNNFVVNKHYQIGETCIVPHPQDKSSFYVFTLQRKNNTYSYPPIIKKEESYNKHFTTGFSNFNKTSNKFKSGTYHLYYAVITVNLSKEIIFLEQNRKLLDFKTANPSIQALRHKNSYSVLVLDGSEAMLNIDNKGFRQNLKVFP